MRSRVYATVGCPSVRLSVPSIDSSSGVRLFDTERGRLQQILIVKLQVPAVSKQQMREASRKFYFLSHDFCHNVANTKQRRTVRKDALIITNSFTQSK